MTMSLRRFQRLLDAHGADLAHWPASQREAAERLLAGDAAAVAARARARALDALILREPAGSDAGAARLVRALETRPLPPQRRHFLWRQWPTELLNLEFTPAWPRLAALAGLAALGFILGLTDIAGPITTASSGEETASILADNDIGAVVFAPDPLPEARP
ncbi:MAG TPA: hypothetical protein VK456_07985 [Xanthobacteraceae bacterium]|nr:hypothetical protein [Xanthobacteraceae bacterium]